MSKLNRFFASCLLIISLSVVALADGGETQGPTICTESTTAAAPEANQTPDNSFPILDALRSGDAIVWLLTEIL